LPANQDASSPALKASPAPVESVSQDSGAGTFTSSVAEYQDAPCRPWVTTAARTAAMAGREVSSSST